MQAAGGASLTDAARSRLGLIIGIGAVAWLVDQATKTLAVHRLDGQPSVRLIGDIFQLTLTRNSGAAFSTGESLTVFISLFACVALVVVLVVARRVRDTVWAWAFGLLLAGIAGNLTDRLFREPGPLRGHVIDFFHLTHWPVFNVADICINVAAGLIVLQSLRGVPLAGRPATPAEDGPGTSPGTGPESSPGTGADTGTDAGADR